MKRYCFLWVLVWSSFVLPAADGGVVLTEKEQKEFCAARSIAAMVFAQQSEIMKRYGVTRLHQTDDRTTGFRDYIEGDDRIAKGLLLQTTASGLIGRLVTRRGVWDFSKKLQFSTKEYRLIESEATLIEVLDKCHAGLCDLIANNVLSRLGYELHASDGAPRTYVVLRVPCEGNEIVLDHPFVRERRRDHIRRSLSALVPATINPIESVRARRRRSTSDRTIPYRPSFDVVGRSRSGNEHVCYAALEQVTLEQVALEQVALEGGAASSSSSSME